MEFSTTQSDLSTPAERQKALNLIQTIAPSAAIDKTDYMWEFSGAEKGATVSVLGLIHGDETVGFHVIETLIKIAQEKGVFRGKLKLILGNIKAFIEGERFLEENMNRVFDKKNRIEIKEETKRAQEIEPHLKESDVTLDAHSTRAPSPLGAFIVIPGKFEGYESVIKKLGISKVIIGDALFSPDGRAFTTDTFTNKHGGLGVTIEAGWQGDQKTFEVIEGILAALTELDIFEENLTPEVNTSVENNEMEIWDAYSRLTSNEEVCWVHECTNFDTVEAGTTLAVTKNGKEIKAKPKPGHENNEIVIIFPKRITDTAIPPGTELCLLSHKK